MSCCRSFQRILKFDVPPVLFFWVLGHRAERAMLRCYGMFVDEYELG